MESVNNFSPLKSNSQTPCLDLKFLSQPLLALKDEQPNFCAKILAFSQRISPKIGFPIECCCKNHLKTESSKS